MSVLYKVWYDPVSFELKTVTWGKQVYEHQTYRYFETYKLHDYTPMKDCADDFMVIPDSKTIYKKKYFILVADKETCKGDGQEFYVVKVSLPTDEPFTAVIKDLNQRAQISVDSVTDADPYFKVRAFSRCDCRIRVKEVFDGKIRDSLGQPFFKYGRSYIELKFSNPGF